jgi:hypothetical protein
MKICKFFGIGESSGVKGCVTFGGFEHEEVRGGGDYGAVLGFVCRGGKCADSASDATDDRGEDEGR